MKVTFIGIPANGKSTLLNLVGRAESRPGVSCGKEKGISGALITAVTEKKTEHLVRSIPPNISSFSRLDIHTSESSPVDTNNFQLTEMQASTKRTRELAHDLAERTRAAKRLKSDDESAERNPVGQVADVGASCKTKVSSGHPHSGRQPNYILSRPGPRTPNTPEGTTWEEVLCGSPFITESDIGVARDAVVISLAQFQTCLLTKDDRIGRYKNQDIGYVGLSCKYCFGGRFFPSTCSSFVSIFPQTAVKHIFEDCLGAPVWMKKVVEYTNVHGNQSVPLGVTRFGSKGLTERTWARLRSSKPNDIIEHEPEKTNRLLSIPVDLNDEHSMTWRDIVGKSGLVHMSEHYLVPASLFIAMAQYEICNANEFDCQSIGRNRPSISPGYPGICCKFCKGETTPIFPGARIFPAKSGSLAQIDTCGKMQTHIEDDMCNKVPAGILLAIKSARKREAKETRRYGSRKIFFGKVWDRIHDVDECGPSPEASQTRLDDDCPLSISISELARGSVLVDSEMDQGMVSDAHLVAFAQMEPCTLSSKDKCGWYKDREIGFPGVRCRHCKGRPSSGRYFPNHEDFFLRSSKQSIIKHVIENCSCPENVRDSLRELQRRESSRKGWKTTNTSVLGQGKLFHARVWERLYKFLGVDKIYPMPPTEQAQTPLGREFDHRQQQVDATMKDPNDSPYPPQSVDRDWVMSRCVYHCRSKEEIREILDSVQLRRIMERLEKFHQKFLDAFKTMHPNGGLFEDMGFQALHNWYAAWARRVRVGDVEAFGLSLDRRACRSFLFALYDRQRDGQLGHDRENGAALVNWMSRAVLLLLPFERAECLFAMRGRQSRNYGLLWASKLPIHRWFVEAEEDAGKPAMNWRVVQIANDSKGEHAGRSRIVATDGMDLLDRLMSPTSAAYCPEEIERPEFSVLDLPNDMHNGKVWRIHPREQVLSFISKATTIEHFLFVYKSESFTNMLRFLRTQPPEREDVETFLELYRKLFACLEDDQNTSVTRQSITDKLKIQSISYVLELVLPVVRKTSAGWHPCWLRGLCQEFGLDVLLTISAGASE